MTRSCNSSSAKGFILQGSHRFMREKRLKYKLNKRGKITCIKTQDIIGYAM